MRLDHWHIVLGLASLLLLFPAVSAAQTTIDLEEIRREHASGGGDASDESDEDSGGTIDIQSAGGSSTTSFGGEITLEFDKRGSSMLVPAKVGGKSVYFVFDTGASFTTLTPAFAKSIGASPPSNAPSTASRTANGVRRFVFGIAPELTLDGRPHRNVTFGACRACGGINYKGKPIVGLLGLNVLRRYRIDFDHSKGVVRLEPGPQYSDRSHDVAPWIQVSRHTPGEMDLGDFFVAFKVENRAPRAVEVELTVDCKFKDGSTSTISTKRRRVSSGDSEILTAKSGRKYCRVQKVDVESASW